MTDNEIIKDLECCKEENCDVCPFLDVGFNITDCMNALIEKAFDLINRQKAEIGELQKRIVFWREDLNYQPEKERAEAIKEFAEKLKEYSYVPQLSLEGYEVVDVSYIDELVKEMTEG